MLLSDSRLQFVIIKKSFQTIWMFNECIFLTSEGLNYNKYLEKWRSENLRFPLLIKKQALQNKMKRLHAEKLVIVVWKDEEWGLLVYWYVDVELNNLLSKWGNEKRQFDELDVYHHWRAPITCHHRMLVSDH